MGNFVGLPTTEVLQKFVTDLMQAGAAGGVPGQPAPEDPASLLAEASRVSVGARPRHRESRSRPCFANTRS